MLNLFRFLPWNPVKSISMIRAVQHRWTVPTRTNINVPNRSIAEQDREWLKLVPISNRRAWALIKRRTISPPTKISREQCLRRNSLRSTIVTMHLHGHRSRPPAPLGNPMRNVRPVVICWRRAKEATGSEHEARMEIFSTLTIKHRSSRTTKTSPTNPMAIEPARPFPFIVIPRIRFNPLHPPPQWVVPSLERDHPSPCRSTSIDATPIHRLARQTGKDLLTLVDAIFSSRILELHQNVRMTFVSSLLLVNDAMFPFPSSPRPN